MATRPAIVSSHVDGRAEPPASKALRPRQARRKDLLGQGPRRCGPEPSVREDSANTMCWYRTTKRRRARGHAVLARGRISGSSFGTMIVVFCPPGIHDAARVTGTSLPLPERYTADARKSSAAPIEPEPANLASAAVTSRVAIFGGSFNPRTSRTRLRARGSLRSKTSTASSSFRRFATPSPSRSPPSKTAWRCASWRAMAWIPGVEVSDVEAELGGESRTLHTLGVPGRIRTPTGSSASSSAPDILGEAHRWYGFDAIAALAPPIVLGRRRCGRCERPRFPFCRARSRAPKSARLHRLRILGRPCTRSSPSGSWNTPARMGFTVRNRSSAARVTGSNCETWRSPGSALL